MGTWTSSRSGIPDITTSPHLSGASTPVMTAMPVVRELADWRITSLAQLPGLLAHEAPRPAE
jgi:hypothetical protein